MTPFHRRLGFSALIALVAAGCTNGEDGKTDDSGPAACTGPVAAAGADQSASVGGTATLDGSASTACDMASITYSWNILSVPMDSQVDNADLDTTDPAKPTVVVDLPGTYVVGLTVTDASGVISAEDLVVITVGAGSSRPVADCGGNKVAQVGDRVDFDGSGSSDPEGAELTYAWTLTTIPSCSSLAPTSLYNANTAAPTLVPDCADIFLVSLVVSDGEQWSEPDYCSIAVGTGNQAPVAEAGNSGNLSPCTEHTYELDGYGSYDPEGAPLTYQWALLYGPEGSSTSNASFSDRTVPNPVFTWDVTGEYGFELRVSDGTTDSAPDIVVLNFQDASQNSSPIANAGSDQSVSREADCDTTSYTWSCEDCPVEDVNLNGTASDDPVDGDDLNFAWSESSGQVTFSAPNSPQTIAYLPGTPATYNSASTRSWTVNLAVSDCADTATDSVTVTYTCTGTYSH